MEVLGQRYLAPKRKAEMEFDQANRQKVRELYDVIDMLVLKMLVRGCHGEAAVKFSVHDGVIQLIEDWIGRKHR